MKTTALIVASLLTTFCPAFSQDWALAQLEKSPRHQEWVTVKHGTREVKSFIVYPEVKDKAVAVVVIHEIFGLTDWVRNVADKLAASGYIAIAPDLLSGMAPGGGGTAEFDGTDSARKAVSSLPGEQVTGDLQAVSDYVAKLPAANGKLAVAGFCWGGRQTFQFATDRKDMGAAFVFYGNGPEDASAIDRISCPVFGFYGEDDNRVNSTIPQSKELMAKAGKTFEPVIYEGAGHGFMRAGEAPDAKEANAKAMKEAWEKWLSILGKI